MFSFVSVWLSKRGRVSHVTITHDALDFTIQRPSPRIYDVRLPAGGCNPSMLSCYCPKMKLRKGNVFTPVPDFFQGGVHPPKQTPPRQTPSPIDGHCSRRYASYWNAFLLLIISVSFPAAAL